jgi:hypothetical protein
LVSAWLSDSARASSYFGNEIQNLAEGKVPRFEPASCPIDVPDELAIDCGYLVVPEDYEDPRDTTIRLPAMIIHSRHAHETPPDRIARLAQALAGLLAVVTIGFSLIMRSVLRSLAATNPMVLRFGLPAGYEPLLIIPTVAALLTVVLLIFTVLAWMRGYWSVLGRLFFTLVTLAALVFTGLMVTWGLLVY